MAYLTLSEKSVHLDKMRIGYAEIGSGEPVLFIHGAGIIGGWDFVLPWSNDFRVICPFQAGWGSSDDPALNATIDDYVDQNLALMDALNIDRFHLIGFSMGGWIASKLAAFRPERIRRLVLVAPAGLWDPERKPADLFAIDPAQILDYLAADPQVLLKYFPPSADPDAQRTELYRNDSAFARLAWQKLGTEDHLRLLRCIRARTLLLWGEQDRIIPFSQASLWQRSIPGARLHRLPNTGHYPFLEEPDSVEVVRDFLRSRD